MTGLQSYVVSYDIMEPKRLAEVHKTMMGYGQTLHYSVFRCDLNSKGLDAMVADLDRIINHKEDRIMIIDMGPAKGCAGERIRFLGIKQKWENHRAKIF
ncbi:MAG: CRISPR-associated endonuclease Cas2 [Methanothrix sp.]|nr:CRISPR-associated endonuclease Cas2 [Methanothrix sp.]